MKSSNSEELSLFYTPADKKRIASHKKLSSIAMHEQSLLIYELFVEWLRNQNKLLANNIE